MQIQADLTMENVVARLRLWEISIRMDETMKQVERTLKILSRGEQE